MLRLTLRHHSLAVLVLRLRRDQPCLRKAHLRIRLFQSLGLGDFGRPCTIYLIEGDELFLE